MTERPECCPYPDDLEGCRASLIRAKGEDSLDQHCIFEGLRANCPQCRKVLREGLYDEQSRNKATGTGGNPRELEEACKQVVLSGYPLGIQAIAEIFVESYYRLVRSKIRQRHIKDRGLPSADDVFQKVFVNLHQHLRKGASVRGPLAAYVSSVTGHECFRSLKEAAAHGISRWEDLQIKTSVSTTLLPSSAIECWEDLDRQLVRSDQGNLINRIIFAQAVPGGLQNGQDTFRQASNGGLATPLGHVR